MDLLKDKYFDKNLVISLFKNKSNNGKYSFVYKNYKNFIEELGMKNFAYFFCNYFDIPISEFNSKNLSIAKYNYNKSLKKLTKKTDTTDPNKYVTKTENITNLEKKTKKKYTDTPINDFENKNKDVKF